MDTPAGQSIEVWLPTPEATEEIASRLAGELMPGLIVYLRGALGAGKTTLVRGFLKAVGYRGRVRSPTYTLVEVYPGVAHFDLYRLGDPEELEWLGARDYFADATLCFVEWPEKGGGYLPPPDLVFDLVVAGEGRRLIITAYSDPGARVICKLKHWISDPASLVNR